MIGRAVSYWIACDEDGCEESEEFQYGRDEAIEFKNRGVRFARTMASRAGWSAFSDRDLCPEHSHKSGNRNDRHDRGVGHD